MKTFRAVERQPVAHVRWLVRAAVAAAISSSCITSAHAQESDAANKVDGLQEVQITGSRIVRRDTETTSPLITVDREVIERSSYISIEQALNELPEFMAGGPLAGGTAVTSLSAAGDVAGGSGSGNMFDTARPVDNARLGTYTPGAATVNLRGLGPNRSLTLIDGRRAIASNASGAIDLNTIPQIAISNIEVITGGASSVYGADALAGVTNILLRKNFEGVEARARAGVNESGRDGKEWQLSSLMGLNINDRGHAMVALDFSKREVALWRNRSYFREAMESPLSNSGDLLFSYWPGYTPGALTNQSCPAGSTVCTTNSRALNAGGGSVNVFNNAWAGNFPSQAGINAIFSDRTCLPNNCITPRFRRRAAISSTRTARCSRACPRSRRRARRWPLSMGRRATPARWAALAPTRPRSRVTISPTRPTQCPASRHRACRSSTMWTTTVGSPARARVTRCSRTRTSRSTSG